MTPPARRRPRLPRAAVLAALALGAVLPAAGCGGSSRPQGPPDLLFVSTRDGAYAIYGADADAKHAYRLTKEQGDAFSPARLFFQTEPAWSPDGKRIAFVSNRDGVSRVYAMDAGGAGTRRLTDTAKADTHPSWSPDGRWIVFSREGALFRVPAAGGPAARVGRGLGSARNPAYSPDGKLIAYDYQQPGFETRQIWVMRADGTGRRLVTRLVAVSSNPAWSPDGRRIAFQSDARSVHAEIWTVGADGSGLRRETVDPDLESFQPAWRPGGTAIAFARDGALWQVEDGRETQLTSGDDNDSNPVFRPGLTKEE